MQYHALFVIFEKAAKFENCRLPKIIGGALRVNIIYMVHSELNAALNYSALLM